ncbi:hypothetical protein V6N12_059047 [Hibiscus sabdariffa]|uniref:Uncharacterized protein n=1 Tax=Hibiscus sabdariffa TaxID=183260 RepID=A0ABR2EXJ8_9ROSI
MPSPSIPMAGDDGAVCKASAPETRDKPLCSYQSPALCLVPGVNKKADEVVDFSQGSSAAKSLSRSVTMDLNNSVSNSEHGAADGSQSDCANVPHVSHGNVTEAGNSLVARNVVTGSSSSNNVIPTSVQVESESCNSPCSGNGDALTSAQDFSHNSSLSNRASEFPALENDVVQSQLQSSPTTVLEDDDAGSTLPSGTTNVHSMVTRSKRAK